MTPKGPTMQDTNAPPLNPLPPVVWALALPIIAMEVVVNLGARGLVGGPEAVGWRLDALQRFAFSPELMRQMIDQWIFPPEQLMRIVTYPFIHFNFTHALFVIVILLAIGKMVGEVFRWWAVLVVFFGAAIAGALAYTLVPGLQAPLIGGYPPVYGLIGGFTFLLWVNLAAVGRAHHGQQDLVPRRQISRQVGRQKKGAFGGAATHEKTGDCSLHVQILGIPLVLWGFPAH